MLPREEKFVVEYCGAAKCNATQAAINAGYSAKTARQQGSRLLSKVYIKNAIDAELDRQKKANQLTADMIVEELRKIAFAKIKDAYNDDGSLKNIKDIPDALASAIASIDITEEKQLSFDFKNNGEAPVLITKSIRYHSKNHALELLGKKFKLWTDRVEHGVTEDYAKLLDEARKRAINANK